MNKQVRPFLKSQYVLCATLCLIACIFFAHAHQAFSADYFSVARNGVNLRSGPGTQYEAIFQVPSGYPLLLLERKGSWLKVQDYEGDKGWIQQSLVSNTPSVIVRVREAKVRSNPSTSAPEVGKAAKDVIFSRTGSQGVWVKVSHANLNGWVNKDLLWP